MTTPSTTPRLQPAATTPRAAGRPALAAAPRTTALACALLSTAALVVGIGALAESRSDAAVLAWQQPQHGQPLRQAHKPQPAQPAGAIPARG